MANINIVRLNGTDYTVEDTTARTQSQTNAQSISVLSTRLSTKQDEIVFDEDDFDYNEDTKELALKEHAVVNVDSQLSTTSTNPVQNKVITAALQGKQDLIANTSRVSVNQDNEIVLNPDTELDTSSTNVVTNAAIAGAIFERLWLTSAEPANPTAGMCILYTGPTTATLNQASIYRYSGVAWVELIGTISNSEIDALFD